MIDQLPQAYISQMEEQLGEAEARAFLASYREPRLLGLRLNPLKIPANRLEDETLRLTGLFGLSPVAWCPLGFTYDGTTRPGKHPYHAAGLYYIQEPSAMSAVELLNPQPGDTVLDLAAAPGGKSTQIAGHLAGRGLLIANEIHPVRARILSENVERMGAACAVVTNSAPGRLAQRFPLFFDKIMLDAPCSGEGMFRKDPEAVAEWSPDHVRMCAARQRDILQDAVTMLKPGGMLAYSTCTFNREENEATIVDLLARHPEFSLIRTERIWPHRQPGEGHFVALLRKADDASGGDPGQRATVRKRAPSRAAVDAWQLFETFAKRHVPELLLPDGEPHLFGEQLYWLPHDAEGRFTPSLLDGIKVPRPGLHLASMKKVRVEPAHALALFLPWSPQSSVQLSAEGEETAAFLRGEALNGYPGQSGWVLVTADGYPLGWGKASGDQIKNHIPKGLRRLR